MAPFSSSFASSSSASFPGWPDGFIGSVAATQCSHGLVVKPGQAIQTPVEEKGCVERVRMRSRPRTHEMEEREVGASSLQLGTGFRLGSIPTWLVLTGTDWADWADWAS